MTCFRYIVDNMDPSMMNYVSNLVSGIGNVSFLQYLHEKGVKFTNDHLETTARSGHLECTKYLYDLGVEGTEYVCAAAAYSDSLECLKYLHENGCPWDYKTIVSAAIKSVKCLEYAVENGCELKITKSAYSRTLEPQLTVIYRLITEGKCIIMPVIPNEL